MNERQDGDAAGRPSIRDAAWVPEPGEMRRAAVLYAARGWAVVPLRPGSKAPAVARWTELRLDARGIAQHFGGGRPNIGVLTGAASGGLVDVDCDTSEAALAAEALLPPTAMVSGRAGHPRSHYWYVVEGELPRTTKYAWEAPCRGDESPAHATTGAGHRGSQEPAHGEGGLKSEDAATAGRTGTSVPAHRAPALQGRDQDTHRGMLVELRADGCQTLVPPSLHPSGERVVWEWHAGGSASADAIGPHGMRPGEGMEPARVTADALWRAVGRVAAAALLARHWPGQGTRDETALALCGMLLRAGWDEEETDLFVRTVARIAGDEEWRERDKAKGTRQRLDAGETVWGAPALAQRLAGESGTGAAVIAQARAWLGIGSGEVAIEHQALIDTYSRELIDNGDPDQQWGLLLSDLDDAQVEWLWQGRVPLGMLTLLDGDPGLGKSLITADLIARVTTGCEMPDGSEGITGGAGAVLLSSEDSQRATIRPRLRAAGADLSRVLVEQTVRAWNEARDQVIERALMLPTDLPLLRRAIERVGAKLVVIDPLMAYLEGRVNSWRDQDIRAALAPLARLAEETGAAILILRHLNKSNGTNAIYRGGGSIGIIGAARSGMLVARSPDDPERERVLAGTKSNLAAPAPSLGYRIATTDEGLPRIAWLGASAYTAATLLSVPASDDPPSVEHAIAYVREALAAGPVPSRELERGALAAGISLPTFARARRQVGAQVRRVGFGRGSQMMVDLPSPPPVSPTQATDPAPLSISTPIVDQPTRIDDNGGTDDQCASCDPVRVPPSPSRPRLDERTDGNADYAASVYLLEQRARSQAGRGCVECEVGLADGSGGDVCVPAGSVSAVNCRSTPEPAQAEGIHSAASVETGLQSPAARAPALQSRDAPPRPEDDPLVRELLARGLTPMLDPAAAPCPKTGGAHQYALQRDVHYHPVCIECGEADLTRTVRDPADDRARRFARRERAG